MTQAIDTLGKALRHQMVLRVECTSCRRQRYYQTASLANIYGAGRDPLRLQIACEECVPPPQKLMLLESGSLDPALSVLHHNGKGWVARPIRPVKTLRDAWQAYDTHFIYCETYGCGHSIAVDYAKTAAVLGWNFPIDGRSLLPHFFCTKCRNQGRTGKKLAIHAHPDHRPVGYRDGLPELWLRHPQSKLPPKR
ncbi:hypothetical protein [Tianweitania sp.]|uniref:hypothetical protein n=1 Tax=Tianweitania sp. TaxID=2021634 RepID=UPI00289ADE75|nr:hypothetical protein [Tianweitania sp.]